MVDVARANTNVPVAVGFGISNPAAAAKMAGLSDGAIVGSALVKIIAEKGTGAVDQVAALAQEMADAVHAL